MTPGQKAYNLVEKVDCVFKKKSRLYILTYKLIEKDIAQNVAKVCARKHREGLTD